jgi:hypothetical protein
MTILQRKIARNIIHFVLNGKIFAEMIWTRSCHGEKQVA